jgi:argonaute-like protein implicated in RNA metabolism and viral defense
MADNKQLQQVQEASWNVIDTFRETSQMVADSLVTLQDHNLKFAQNIFLSWMELFTQQTESMHHLQQQWTQQVQTQRDAFQKLASTSTQIYMDFLLAPFSLSRRLVDATEEAMQQEREAVWKASR